MHSGSYIAKALAKGVDSYPINRRIQLVSRGPVKIHDTLKREVGEDLLLPPIHADVTDPKTLDDAFDGADVVVSLVGIMHGSPEQFEMVQWHGAENVASAAKKVGAKVVHISAIGADKNSKIPYARTKMLGEEAVRKMDSNATIIRPSLVFGPGDGFFAVSC